MNLWNISYCESFTSFKNSVNSNYVSCSRLYLQSKTVWCSNVLGRQQNTENCSSDLEELWSTWNDRSMGKQTTCAIVHQLKCCIFDTCIERKLWHALFPNPTLFCRLRNVYSWMVTMNTGFGQTETSARLSLISIHNICSCSTTIPPPFTGRMHLGTEPLPAYTVM